MSTKMKNVVHVFAITKHTWNWCCATDIIIQCLKKLDSMLQFKIIRQVPHCFAFDSYDLIWDDHQSLSYQWSKYLMFCLITVCIKRAYYWRQSSIIVLLLSVDVVALRKQEAQLSQWDRATLRVIEYFAKSLKVTQGHLKWHCWVDKVPISISMKLCLDVVFLTYSAWKNGVTLKQGVGSFKVIENGAVW